MLAGCLAAAASSQQDATAFARNLPEAEARVAKWRDLVVPFAPRIAWVDDGKSVAFTIGEGDARRHVRVDCATGERRESADPKALATAKIDETNFRRAAMVIVLALILLGVAYLWLTKRRLDRELERDLEAKSRE